MRVLNVRPAAGPMTLGDRILDLIPERKPDRLVEIVKADLIDIDDAKIIVATFADQDGKPEGRAEIAYESDDKYEQEKGQEKLRKLLGAIDLESLSDTDELVGRVLTVTSSGDFRQAQAA